MAEKPIPSRPVTTPLPDHLPLIDPENARFYHSGAGLPSYDQSPDDRGPDTESGPASIHRGADAEPTEFHLARARVYRPARNIMQAGRARQHQWVVEFEPLVRPGIDPLMGWVSSGDPLQQVRMTFDSLEAALGYCRRQRLATEVETPAPNRPRPKSYSENFASFEDGSPKPV